MPPKVSEEGKAQKEVTVGALTFAEFREVVAAGLPLQQARELAADGFSYDMLLELAEAMPKSGGTGITAEEMRSILNQQRPPENKRHPGISDFSYPEGDLKRPKPDLPYDLFWLGYAVHKARETESWYDWELYAQLEPGVFTVICKDGAPMQVDITAERDGRGKVTKLTVLHPRSRENKHNIPPLYVVLWQLVHPSTNPRKAFVEAMQKWLELSMGVTEPA